MSVLYPDCPKYSPGQYQSRCRHYQAPLEDKRETGTCRRPSEFLCQVDIANGSFHLSHSSLQDYLKCPYLFYLRHVRKISIKPPFVSQAIKMGAMWDAIVQLLLGGFTAAQVREVINRYEIGDMDQAKVRAVYRAYKTLEIQTDTSEFELQKRFYLNLPGCTVTGIMDRSYGDYFCENKFTGNKDFYLDIHFLSSQIGTYFLADQKLDHCIMEIVQAPQLRNTGKQQTDEPAEYEERIYKDVLSRPSFYYIGYDREKRTYGKKFHRREFLLDEIAARYETVFSEICRHAAGNSWYKNSAHCMQPWKCDYLSVCRFNAASEEMYDIPTPETVSPAA